MSPLTHLLASWIVAAKTTDNLRDRRLVTLAGVAPDLDGLGLLVDTAKGAFTTGKFYYYPEYHHWLTHGLPAARGVLGIAGRVWPAALARVLAVAADVSSALAVRPGGFARAGQERLLADLLFRPDQPAPDVDLEISMAAGWLAKYQSSRWHSCVVVVAGGQNGRFLRRRLQPPGRQSFRRRAAKVVAANWSTNYCTTA